ncbi:MAG: hypothetical protein H6810_07345 [Phycisphaeraceae bacterium]|nr:MAG: hypothetical protein H6810_07345 [Phycisphaeraceae bacterium]
MQRIATIACLLAAGSLTLAATAGHASKNSGDRAARRDAPTKTWVEHVDGRAIQVTGTTGPRYEPADGYSAKRRQGERERAELRQRLNWGSLSDDMKASLAPVAVGPDNIDDRGINLVNFAWAYTPTYRGNDHRALDMELTVDGDVTVIGQDLGNGSSDPDYSAMQLSEISGTANAAQGWTENWERTVLYAGSGLGQYVSAKQGGVDLQGNTYAVGLRKNGHYIVWKLDGVDGSVTWNSSKPAPNGGSDAIALDMVVDPEGLIYVCGFYTDAGNGSDRWFVSRHRPSDGHQDWIVDLGGGRPTGGIEIDRRGDLFVGGYNGDDHMVWKVSPYDGAEVWSAKVQTATDDRTVEFTDSLKLDSGGNPCYAGNIEIDGDGGWRTSKWDGETGAQLWTKTEAMGQPEDLEVDQDGNVYVCGKGGTYTFVLRKYGPTHGNKQWTYQGGSTGRAEDIVIDRLGNPYMTGEYDPAFIQTSKHNPEDGTIVWKVDGESPTRNSETNSDLQTRDIVVDGGGNIYVCGFRTGGGSDSGDKEFFCVKYEQPYLSIPQIARSYPTVSMDDVSVWDPVPNPGDPDYTDPSTYIAYNQEWPLFSFDIPSSIENTIEGSTVKTVDYGVGTVTGGIRVNDFHGGVDVFLQAESSAGTFSASATGKLAVAIPGEAELFATQPFDIVVNWDPDEMGTQLLADAEPTLTAGINASTRGNIDIDGFIDDTYLGSDSSPIVNNKSLAYTPDDPILGIGPGSLPQPGVWVDLVEFPYDQYFSGQVRSPYLQTEGVFNASTSTISSSIRQKVLAGKARITELILAYFGQPPLNVSVGAGYGGPGWDANFEAGLLQADLDGDLYVLQDLDAQFKPYVVLDYEASDGTSLGSERLDFHDGSGNPVEQRTATTTLPADGEMTIKPRFGIDVAYTNSSGVEFVITESFNPARLEASLSIADTDVIDVDKCFQCISNSNSFEFRPYDITKSISFPSEYNAAPIQVFGNVNLQPQLIGASVESLRMIIYDQRNPSQANLNGIVDGTIPVVLYGYNFFSGTNIQVRLKHQGRNEALQRTRLNDQAILVQIPKRFLLVPGVARLLVRNDNGRSETIDLTIEYPFPNFQGIEENFWASDPRWTETPVTVVDGGTPAGHDSFIARRDYFPYLATQLWNSAFLQDLSDPNIPAWSYFPAFAGWELPGHPKSPPGIPTLLADGVTVPRDKSDPTSGYLKGKVPEPAVSRSDFVSLSLVSPGPGGGESRTRVIELPAPRPVINQIKPALVRPGESTEDIRLQVKGPATVPFFAGYESEKHGNFTPDSQVWIDKTPYPTEFVSSGELVATVPAADLDTFGSRLVWVKTSNPNGTMYPETLIDGNGNVVLDEMVPSGGNSVPMVLQVLWPEPVINYVSHATIEQGNPPAVPDTIDGAPPPDNHNISIFGDNFDPNCRVYLDGVIIPSTRDPDSPSVVRVTITAADVATLGTRTLIVENPAPNLRASAPFQIEVVQASP